MQPSSPEIKCKLSMKSQYFHLFFWIINYKVFVLICHFATHFLINGFVYNAV